MPVSTPVTFEDIFILSKGRHAQTRTTWETLMDDHIPFSLVVEPQELALYQVRLKQCASDRVNKKDGKLPPYRFVVLPRNDQGVSFARNCVLQEYAPPKGWFWIMDDDIAKFYHAINGKTTVITAAAMLAEVSTRMSVCVHRRDIAMFALEYQQFSFAYDDDAVSFNSYCNIAVCMTKERMPAGLRYRFRVREDYDFVLQLVKAGYATVRFRNLAFGVPGMGQKEGGMKAYYEDQKKDIRLQNKLFLEAWSMVAEEVRKGSGPTERDDIRVKWAMLNDPDEAYALLNSKKFNGFSRDPLETPLAKRKGKDDAPPAVVAAPPVVSAAKKGDDERVGSKKRKPSPPSLPPPTKTKTERARGLKAERDEDAEIPSASPPRPQPAPSKVTAPPLAAPAKKKGVWSYEKYRVVNAEEMSKLGLQVVQHPKPGDAICYVPLDPNQPPLLTGTIIASEGNRTTKSPSVTIIPDRRGDAMFCGTIVFSIPSDLKAVKEALTAHYGVDVDDA